MEALRQVSLKFWCSSLLTVLFILVVYIHCTSSSVIRIPFTTSTYEPHVPQYFSSNYHSGAVSLSDKDRRLTTVKRNTNYAHKRQGQESHEGKPQEKEVDSTLDDLLEVMGPHLFLIPFVLTALPFAIPAIPLSYIISRREHEHAPISEFFTQFMEFSNHNKTSVMKRLQTS